MLGNQNAQWSDAINKFGDKGQMQLLQGASGRKLLLGAFEQQRRPNH